MLTSLVASNALVTKITNLMGSSLDVVRVYRARLARRGVAVVADSIKALQDAAPPLLL